MLASKTELRVVMFKPAETEIPSIQQDEEHSSVTFSRCNRK